MTARKRGSGGGGHLRENEIGQFLLGHGDSLSEARAPVRMHPGISGDILPVVCADRDEAAPAGLARRLGSNGNAC